MRLPFEPTAAGKGQPVCVNPTLGPIDAGAPAAPIRGAPAVPRDERIALETLRP